MSWFLKTNRIRTELSLKLMNPNQTEHTIFYLTLYWNKLFKYFVKPELNIRQIQKVKNTFCVIIMYHDMSFLDQ